MERDEKLLADVTALVTAIDAELLPSSSSSDASYPQDTVDPSLVLPLENTSDEWLLFDDLFCESVVASDGTRVCDDRSLEEAMPIHTSTRDTGRSATSSDRVKACRNRQKAELAYLKERVHELEHQLLEVKHEKTRSNTSLIKETERSEIHVVTSDAVMQFWQRRAEGERRARARAIAENARLRQALEAQLRLAKSLARVLRKRPNDTHLVQGNDQSSKRHRLHDAGDGEIYEFLMRNMDVRYAQVDTVLEQSGLHTCKTVYQDARLVEPKRSDGRTPWYLEFVDSKVAPFDFALVRDATWRALCTPTVPLDNGVYEVIEATSDVIKAEFRIRMHVGNADVVGRARFVTRRYMEEHRSVLVWALWSTTEGGRLCDQEIRLLEEGWGIVCPLIDDGVDSDAADAGVKRASLSLIQTCGRMRPNMVIKKSSKLETQIGLLTDMLLGTYHDILRGLDDHMGRVMMEEAAARGLV